MARDFKIQATLDVDDKATAKVQKASGAFGKLGELIGPGGLFVAGAAATVVAFQKIGDAIGTAVEAANVQEDAVNRVTTALSLVGQATPEVVSSIEEFASALQKTTTVGDETILNMTALALSFTDTAEEAQELTSAALDFSRGAGIAFEEAVRRLGRSMGGATADIANFAPEIRNLTAEAIKNGDAIDIIAEKYAGFAASEAETFSGALAQLSNNFGDLQEIVGQAITENDFFAEKIRELSDLLGSSEFQQTLKDVVDAIAGFVASIGDGLEAIEPFTQGLGSAIRTLNVMTGGIFDVEEALKFYSARGKQAAAANKELSDSSKIATEGVKSQEEAVKALAAEQDASTTAATALAESFKLLGLTSEAEVTAKVEELTGALATQRLAFEAGEITSAGFALAQEAVKEKVGTLLGLTKEQTAQLKLGNQQQITNIANIGKANLVIDEQGKVTKRVAEASEEHSIALIKQAAGLETVTEEAPKTAASEEELAAAEALAKEASDALAASLISQASQLQSAATAANRLASALAKATARTRELAAAQAAAGTAGKGPGETGPGTTGPGVTGPGTTGNTEGFGGAPSNSIDFQDLNSNRPKTERSGTALLPN